MPSPSEDQTLVISYVCSVLAFCLICSRMICRLSTRNEKLRPDDKWMAFSTIPLIVRMGTIHAVMVYGSNSGFDAANPPSPEKMGQMRIAAQAVLASRIHYAGFLWCMKGCMLVFYGRITGESKGYGIALMAAKITLVVTFLIVFFSTILECRPIHQYYDIVAKPPSCVKAIGQLFTMGICNIFTDLMLIVLPLPFIYKSKLPLFRKIQIILVFCVGFFVISITLIRLPVIVSGPVMQKTRTLWASVECFVACFVANAPCMNVFLQNTIRKIRARRSGHNETGSIDNMSCRGGCDAVMCHDLKPIPAPPLYSKSYSLEESTIATSIPPSRKSSIVPGEEFVEEDGDFTKNLSRSRQGSAVEGPIQWNQPWAVAGPIEASNTARTLSPPAPIRHKSVKDKSTYLEGWRAGPDLESATPNSNALGTSTRIFSPKTKSSEIQRH